jgi:hypothetical protein
LKAIILLASLFFTAIGSAVSAEEISFLCYDLLTKKTGDGYNSSFLRPNQLTFDTTLQTVSLVNHSDWDCDVVRWGDPLIYFSCSYEHKQDIGKVVKRGDLVITVDVFDRNSARYSRASVGPADVTSVYKESEVGDKRTSRVNVPYEACERKHF